MILFLGIVLSKRNLFLLAAKRNTTHVLLHSRGRQPKFRKSLLEGLRVYSLP